MYRDARLQGFDAAAVVEVIEHLDPPRLRAFERVLFEFARPATVVLTTPNAEYNVTLAVAAGGPVPAPRPPLRVDARGVPGVGDGRRRAVRLRGAVPAGRRRGRPRSARRRRWRCSRDDALTDSRALARRADRPVRLRQVHVRPQALQADRGAVVGRCRGLVSDDENDQAATNDAFEVLHFVAAQRPGARRG